MLEHRIRAAGWDPAHHSEAPLAPADVVNLGYVLNVIENPDERARTLRAAFDLARRVLVVAVRVARDVIASQRLAGVDARPWPQPPG